MAIIIIYFIVQYHPPPFSVFPQFISPSPSPIPLFLIMVTTWPATVNLFSLLHVITQPFLIQRHSLSSAINLFSPDRLPPPFPSSTILLPVPPPQCPLSIHNIT